MSVTISGVMDYIFKLDLQYIHGTDQTTYMFNRYIQITQMGSLESFHLLLGESAKPEGF